MLEIRTLPLLALALVMSTQVGVAQTLTFEDWTGSNYGGFTWLNFGVTTAESGGGYANGIVSGSYVAYGGAGMEPSDIVRDAPFDFTSAYLTAAWNNGLNVQVTGYLQGNAIYQQALTIDTDAPTLFAFNFLGVDRVNFVSSGGTSAGLGGSGTHFAMDDATFSASTVTPEPLSMALLGTGLFGLGAMRRRRGAKEKGCDLAIDSTE